MVLHASRPTVLLVASLFLACSPEATRPVDRPDDQDDDVPPVARVSGRDAAPAAINNETERPRPTPDGPEPDAFAARAPDAARIVVDAGDSPDARPMPGGGPVIIAAAGDIATNGSGPALQTATLLRMLIKARGLSAILTLGDNAYPDGAASDFSNKFAPTWGHPEIKPLLRPVPGNHDYHVTDAAPYYAFFGAAGGQRGKGYYSYNVGSWHVIALNTNDDCKLIGCGPGSEQHKWLLQDLEANKTKCTLAYWHHPRFQQGSKHGDREKAAPLWDALYDAGADVVLTGHDHNYQQFAPMNKAGQVDRTRGIRSFVVGTGGSSLYTSFSSAHADALEYKQATDHGVLELTLAADAYEWRFVSVKGTEMIKGKDMCR